MDYPYNLSTEEVIRKITEVYHAGYDLNNLNFDIYDQLLACEATDESQEEYKERNTNRPHENASVSESVNGSYKRGVNFELSDSQLLVVDELKGCNYQTPPVKIAKLLEEFFKEYESKEKHWLWIAQTYTARVVNRVMSAAIKKYLQGGIRKTLPAYFTYLLKFRKKRKEFRSSNDNH